MAVVQLGNGEIQALDKRAELVRQHFTGFVRQNHGSGAGFQRASHCGGKELALGAGRVHGREDHVSAFFLRGGHDGRDFVQHGGGLHVPGVFHLLNRHGHAHVQPRLLRAADRLPRLLHVSIRYRTGNHAVLRQRRDGLYQNFVGLVADRAGFDRVHMDAVQKPRRFQLFLKGHLRAVRERRFRESDVFHGSLLSYGGPLINRNRPGNTFPGR